MPPGRLAGDQEHRRCDDGSGRPVRGASLRRADPRSTGTSVTSAAPNGPPSPSGDPPDDRGGSPRRIFTRIAQRLPAMATAILPNWRVNPDGRRSLIADDY